MLNNIEPIEELRGTARSKFRDYETQTVKLSAVTEALAQGWHILQKNEKTVRLKREKSKETRFRDRVWTFMYRMGFIHMNGSASATLLSDLKDDKDQAVCFDVVGIDNEVGVTIKCIVSDETVTYSRFREEIERYIPIRSKLKNTINQQFALPFDQQEKRQIATAIFTSNILLTEEDKKRAKNGNIILFDDNDLKYYEDLVSHLSSAAKYQFLADMLPGKEIPGLNITVPAIKTKMGGYTCYAFSVSPEYLLKIAYVSHRAKGRGSDVHTYQRMLQKSRLQTISKYIDQEGIFPTNIVISLDKKPTFDKREQETEQENAVMGWLRIKTTYKSAWIIDGQHRLFAYSGHPRAKKSSLAVLAFETLPADIQAKLFIDINAKQKSVKHSLLAGLYADLHKDSSDPSVRIRSIISQAIQFLDADPQSPFYHRIQNAEEKRDNARCISLNSIFKALDSDLYIKTNKKGSNIVYGPLWSDKGNDAILQRSLFIINKWFSKIRDTVPDWWDTGSGEGGGLAMNDSIVAHINVLRSIFHYLESRDHTLLTLNNEDLFQLVEQYESTVCRYLSSLNEAGRRNYRLLRGSQGQTTRMKYLQQAIHEANPDFSPAGLANFLAEQKAQTNSNAKEIVDRIEKTLQSTVLSELKQEFGPDEFQWWTEGVQKSIRMKVSQRHEDDDGKRGGREYYFDLLDYRHIIQQHWNLFSNIFGYGKANSGKDKRTAWINDVNEIRRIVAHSSSGRSVTVEQLYELEKYDEWLKERIAQFNANEDSILNEDASQTD